MSKELKCDGCGCPRPKKARRQTISLPFSGKTALGRPIEAEVQIKVWLCACGRQNAEAISMPLDPDAGLLRAYEQEFGAASPTVLRALAKLKLQACLQLAEEPDDNEEFFLDIIRRVRAELGHGWPEQVDFAGTEFVIVEPPAEGQPPG